MHTMRTIALAATFAAAPALAGTALAVPDQTLGVAIMSALVEANGNLHYGAGAVSSTYDTTGTIYRVKFNRPLRGCVSSATAGYHKVIANSALAGDTAVVELWNLDGSAATVPLQLIVFCSGGSVGEVP